MDFGHAYMDGDIVRWKSNNAVPPTDILESFVAGGHINSHQQKVSIETKDAELSAFLDAYRLQQLAFRAKVEAGDPEAVAADNEIKAEARAAHGPGVVLVNLLTGQKFVT